MSSKWLLAPGCAAREAKSCEPKGPLDLDWVRGCGAFSDEREDNERENHALCACTVLVGSDGRDQLVHGREDQWAGRRSALPWLLNGLYLREIFV